MANSTNKNGDAPTCWMCRGKKELPVVIWHEQQQKYEDGGTSPCPMCGSDLTIKTSETGD